MTLLHPTVPEKIVAIGLNYLDHAKESELAIADVPVVFAKFTSSLIGPGAAIVIPREDASRLGGRGRRAHRPAHLPRR